MKLHDKFKHFKKEHPTSKVKSDAKKAFKSARSSWEKKKKELESARGKHEKSQKTKTREKLETAVAKLRGHEAEFRKAASAAFDKLQDDERVRSEFMKEVLLEYDEASNIVNLHQADSNAVSAAISAISTEQDLETFAGFYGPGQDLVMCDDLGIWPVVKTSRNPLPCTENLLEDTAGVRRPPLPLDPWKRGGRSIPAATSQCGSLQPSGICPHLVPLCHLPSAICPLPAALC